MAAREQSPASWRGALPCSYPLGPGFSDSDWSLEVTVSTANIVSTSYDVVAAIKGAQDPGKNKKETDPDDSDNIYHIFSVIPNNPIV